jgi:Domain of unknown function (DUF1833)
VPLTPSFIQALTAQETGVVSIALITITHPATPEIGRISSDPTQRLGEDPLRYGTISRGQVYQYLPVGVIVPDSQEQSPPLSRLSIDNIDRELISLIRASNEPATMTIEVVSADELDVVQQPYPPMDVMNVQYDQFQAIFELQYKPLQAESFPMGSFTPTQFPGLFP